MPRYTSRAMIAVDRNIRHARRNNIVGLTIFHCQCGANIYWCLYNVHVATEYHKRHYNQAMAAMMAYNELLALSVPFNADDFYENR